MSNCDNKFGKCCGCPALMGGDRAVTNYLLNSKLNAYVKKLSCTKTSHETRLYLQQNAQTIIDNEQKHLNNTFKCDSEKLGANSKCNNLRYPISDPKGYYQ